MKLRITGLSPAHISPSESYSRKPQPHLLSGRWETKFHTQ